MAQIRPTHRRRGDEQRSVQIKRWRRGSERPFSGSNSRGGQTIKADQTYNAGHTGA